MLPETARLTAWLLWLIAGVVGLNVAILLLGQAVRFPLGRVSSRGRDLTDRVNGLLGAAAIGFAALIVAQLVMRLQG
jgi:hypothetical protein